MTVALFLIILWQASMRLTGILQPNFSNLFTNFSSRMSSSTSLERPIMSRHSCLEYYPLAQRGCSTFTSILDKKELACFVTERSDSSFQKASFNLRISSSTLLLAWQVLISRDKTIGIMSFLFILCINLFVQIIMFPHG